MSGIKDLMGLLFLLDRKGSPLHTSLQANVQETTNSSDMNLKQGGDKISTPAHQTDVSDCKERPTSGYYPHQDF